MGQSREYIIESCVILTSADRNCLVITAGSQDMTGRGRSDRMITALVRMVNVKMTQIRPLKPEIEWGIYARNEGSIFSNIRAGGFVLSSGGFILALGDLC